MDAESLKEKENIEYYYIQILQTIYQWTEFIEQWILKTNMMSVDQHTKEIKMIEMELSAIQQHLIKIKELTQCISPSLQDDVKTNILQLLSALQNQIDSTKKLSSDSFGQISVWHQENCGIDEELKYLNSYFSSSEKKLEALENAEKVTVSETVPLKLELVKYCNKFESLSAEKLKLSLKWPGCVVKNMDDALNLVFNTKIKAYKVYERAIHTQTDVNYYNFTFESLKELCDVLESFFQLDLCINDGNELSDFCLAVKNSLIFLEILAFRCEESFVRCKSYLQPEDAVEFNALISRVASMQTDGRNKIKIWHLCLMHINELEKLTHSSSMWLKEKYEISKDHPCPKKDLPNYIAFLKGLQCEIKDHLHQINRISELKHKVNIITTFPPLDTFIDELLDQYKEFQENIDSRVLNINMFSKQWTQFELDLEALQKWLLGSESRLKHIQHMVIADDDLPSLIENIRSILRLESEAECKEESYEQVKSAIEQSITLNIFHEHGQNILSSINDQWNEIIQSITAIKMQFLNKLNGVQYSEVAEQLNLWMTDVKKSYKSHPIRNVNSVSDLQLLKYELWNWKKDVTIMEKVCKVSSVPDNLTTENENLLSGELQALKFELIFHLEKVQFFINKLIEFSENSNYLLHLYEIMQAHLIKINDSNKNKNRYALLNNLDEIEKYKNEFRDNENKYSSIKQMVPVICEKTDSDDIKNYVLSKYRMLEQYYLSIPSIISSTEVAAENNVKLWNKYHEHLELCHHYIIEQENVISLYNSSILNLQHLRKTIPKLNDVFQDFLSHENLLNDVLESSTSVKDCADAGIQLEIDSDCDTLINKWNALKNSFCHLIETQNILETQWDTYSVNFDSLSEWISNMQTFVISFHLKRSYISGEYKKCFEELTSKKSSLISLKESGYHLCTYSNLHHLAKKSLETSFHSLSTSMESLEKAFIYCQEITSSMIEDELNRKKNIKEIENSLNNINMAVCDIEPSNKQELEASLSNTEEVLQDISQHYTDLSHMKEHLILQEVFDFISIDKITVNLQRIQEITSKLSRRYLKLIETSAKNNTFLENCTLLMQLLRKLKDLHTTELPSDYWSLIACFLKSQIMEIYIHSHEIIMLQIINSGELSSSLSSRFGTQHLYNSVCEFVKEWNSVETVYRIKMSLVKERIYLWQKYLLHIHKIRSSLKFLRKEITQKNLVSNIQELKEEICRILELKTCLGKCLEETDLLKNDADALHDALRNPDVEGSIQNQISELTKQIETEVQGLLAREIELREFELAFNNLTSGLKTTHERLSSVQLYITQGIPSSFEDMKKELERAEVKKITNEETLEILDNMDVTKLKCENTNIQNTIVDEIATQKNLCQVLNCELSQHISLLHRNLDRLHDFERKYMYLMKWCEKIEQKINEEFSSSPENAVNKLNIIEEEINAMKLEVENTISFGNSLLQNEIMHNVSDKISSLNSASTQILRQHRKRLETLRRIISCLENLSEASEMLNNFLTASEGSLELSLHLKDLPYDEIENKLSSIQVLGNEIVSFDEVSTKMEALLKELDSYTINFNSIILRNALQYSESVLHKWTSFKTVIAKQSLSLQNMKNMWEEFLMALERVEEWLKCKEEIASKVNYSDRGHSRNTYLEGVGIFEKLNHCFQDDVQLLHSMNASFHNISKKEFNISNSLKNRVLTANDQWQKLYKRIVEIFEAVKNILQIWDHFDQLKEHLLLFLTEIDLKLTEIETTNLFQETSCENIEEDFKLHEDEKERFIATAKHLMQQSECSTSIIQASVDEVENYWEDLYKRLKSVKKATIHTTEKENTELISTSVVQSVAKYEDLKEESDKELKEKPSAVDGESTVLLKSMVENSEIGSEADHQQTGPQTYSEVVAMSSGKSVQIEQVVSKPDDVAEKKSKIYSQEQTATHHTQTKRSSFDDDCTKDLLAALKEAEERMDSLEKVLSELTPSGIDEQGPNYSRLLAACRSSVDVIQHLSQFLFYDVPHDTDGHEKVEIKLQSEDVLQRWQRIENLALDKESRIMENRRSWETFTKELKGFETWIQNALQDYNIESYSDTDIEKVVILLQKHKELISQIRAQKKIILTLNLTGQKFLNTSTESVKTSSLKQRIKTVNDHWDNLYSTALQWQSKLQSEFVQSSEFRSTIDEMSLWLRESEKRVEDMSQVTKRDDRILHEQHTELFALKQQLEVYCSRIETLLEITLHLFLPEFHSDENPSLPEERLTQLQTELKSNLKMSQLLLIKCTEMLKSVSSLLGFSKFREHISQSKNGAAAVSQTDSRSTDRSECCSFLMRVARASFPIQAILLLLLGAAILLPMEEEEELSCRLSNNFAASLNPMLRYPDGPPPV